MSDSPPTAAFVAPAPADLAPMFPGYEIGPLIATGGMGAVYQAVQRSLERTVALKILPHEFSADAAFCAGFEAEAKAMARLNHPNLIGVYDFGEAAGMLYIIMEYVPGKSLFHSAHGIAIDPAEVIRLISGICSGLAHAHGNGIIHRDIKPSNILLDPSANPKIGDFGLARPADHQIQEGEEIFGTPHYTAPEVISTPGHVDHRADIFSVGVMLHELLTGRLPADDRRSASVIAHCDPRFDAIIRRATDPIPDHRYASALEIANELQTIATTSGPKVLRTAPVPATAGAGSRKGKARRQDRKSSAVPVIIIFLAAVTLAVFAYRHHLKQKLARQSAAQASVSVVVEPPPAPALPPALPPAPEEPVPPPVVFEPDPTPLPGPEPSAEPLAPEPPSPAAEPKFDVPGFLSRARKVMRARAEPAVRKQNAAIEDNLEAMERNLKRALRKQGLKPREQAVGALVEQLTEECKSQDSRIPAILPAALTVVPGFQAVHAEFLEKQQALESSLASELSQYSATYLLGIEKQIERLKPTDDPAAIGLLEQELQSVRGDEGYFTGLMLAPDSE